MHCAAAMSLLGIDAAEIGNMWYLSNNPAVANFDTGQVPMTPSIICQYSFTIRKRQVSSSLCMQCDTGWQYT